MDTYNQIIQGDCTAVLRSLSDRIVDFFVTDPPYLLNYRDRAGRAVLIDDCPERVLSCVPELFRVMKQDTLCVCFYGWSRIDAFFDAWTTAGFRPVGHIVWCKDYVSRYGLLQSRHEQAYVVAKGRPAKPDARNL